MLEQAFEALDSYDWGTDYNAVKPIDDAVVSTYGDDAARAELQAQLIAALEAGLNRDGTDFVCRRLRTMGTAEAVPALAALLPDADNSHMARYALERIPATEAGDALRASLDSVGPELQVGVLSSLGVRQEDASVEPIAALVGDGGTNVALAAARALGDIRSAAAAEALSSAESSDSTVQAAITNSLFCCAEQYLADGNKAAALGIYRKLSTSDIDYVRQAATKGMLACAGG